MRVNIIYFQVAISERLDNNFSSSFLTCVADSILSETSATAWRTRKASCAIQQPHSTERTPAVSLAGVALVTFKRATTGITLLEQNIRD